METITMLCIWAGTGVVLIGLFVRIEHRLTKVETTLTIIAGRIGLCQPNLGKNGQ